MTLVWRQAMGSLTTCLMRAFVAGLVLSLAPLAALAEGSTPRCDLGNYDPAQRPDPEGTPTEVGVGVYVVQVDRVDNVDQSFRLDTFIRLSWRDPRLAAVVAAAGVSSCRFPLADVWEPRIILFNRREATSCCRTWSVSIAKATPASSNAARARCARQWICGTSLSIDRCCP